MKAFYLCATLFGVMSYKLTIEIITDVEQLADLELTYTSTSS